MTPSPLERVGVRKEPHTNRSMRFNILVSSEGRDKLFSHLRSVNYLCVLSSLYCLSIHCLFVYYLSVYYLLSHGLFSEFRSQKKLIKIN